MNIIKTIFRAIAIAVAALLFILIGLLLLAGFSIFPYLRQKDMDRWQPANCTIIANELLEDTTTKNPTYRIKLTYAYRFGGKEYSSDLFSLHENFSAEPVRKRAIVQGNPTGTHRTCFVNPADPSQAVLDRTPPSDLWLGVFGLPFLIAGLFVVYHTSAPFIKKLIPSTPVPLRYDGKNVLKPAETRLKKAAPVLAIAVFWNLFMALAAWLIFHSAKTSLISAGILVFFGFFGLLLLYSGLYQFVRVFSPHFNVSARKEAGGRISIEWTFSQPDLLKLLQISVEKGRPSSNQFPRTPGSGPFIFEGSGDASGKGSATFSHEEDGFSGKHIPPYTIYFYARIRKRPDVQDEFVLES